MTGRRLLRLSGPDAGEFLQGLVTNDVRRAPIYAALLTPQGKYLADFFVIPDGDGLLLDVPAEQGDDLLRRLSLYKLRAKVEIAEDPRPVTRGTGPTGTRCASNIWSRKRGPSWCRMTASSWKWGSNACTASISARAAMSGRK